MEEGTRLNSTSSCIQEKLLYLSTALKNNCAKRVIQMLEYVRPNFNMDPWRQAFYSAFPAVHMLMLSEHEGTESAVKLIKINSPWLCCVDSKAAKALKGGLYECKCFLSSIPRGIPKWEYKGCVMHSSPVMSCFSKTEEKLSDNLPFEEGEKKVLSWVKKE